MYFHKYGIVFITNTAHALSSMVPRSSVGYVDALRLGVTKNNLNCAIEEACRSHPIAS